MANNIDFMKSLSNQKRKQIIKTLLKHMPKKDVVELAFNRLSAKDEEALFVNTPLDHLKKLAAQ